MDITALALLLVLFIGTTTTTTTTSPPTTNEECMCPNLLIDLTCTCTAPRGFIVSTQNESDFEVEYWIDPGYDESAMVIFTFSSSDLDLTPTTTTDYASTPFLPSSSAAAGPILYTAIDPFLDTSESSTMDYFTSTEPPAIPPCYVTLGSHTYDSWGEGGEEILEFNMVTSDTNSSITVLRSDPNCQYNISYVTYKLKKTDPPIFLNATSGQITAPADEYDLFPYRPNCLLMYVINISDSESTLPELKVDFTLNHLSLGGPSYTLNEHEEMDWKVTGGDFLLIGTGEQVLNGREVMYYGSLEEEDVRGVTVVGGLAHLFFYAGANHYNATGFNVTYNTTQQLTTKAPITTTPQPPQLPHTYVSINGIPVTEYTNNNTTNTTSTVQDALASMTTDYLHNYMDQPEWMEFNVTSDNITIFNISSCNKLRCRENHCVAYDFGVELWEEDSPVFTEEELNNMLKEPDMNKYIQAIGDGCEICVEDEPRTLWVYIVVPTVIVVCGIIISLISWKFSAKDNIYEAQERYEQEHQQKIADQKQRRSGDGSIIGLGLSGSVASRGTLASRRFTMPFPKPGRVEVDSDEEEEVDISGYREYDPDVGIIYPEHLGLDRGLLTVQGHTNRAYVDDETKATKIQRTSFANTDSSEDSEGDGAVTFPMGAKPKPKTSAFVVPAEVHMADDVGETAL